MKKPLVVILAGGIGKSFKPLTINKTLIPIIGKPVLQHVIEMVESAGFHEALIITNPENEEWLGSYQPFNITLLTNIVKPTGMGDALLQSEHVIGNQPILIINACDIIDGMFLKTLLQKTYNSYSFITGLKTESYFPGGYIKMEGTKATGIVEKPGPGKEPSNLLNLVFHYFSDPQDFFGLLKKTPTSDDQYEKALHKLMQQRHVDVVPYQGIWTKLKYSHHVLDMMKVLFELKNKNHIARSAKVSSKAVIEGTVYIDEGAEVDAYAVIKGPAYIGRGAIVGNHSLVRQSSIEENAVVGFGCEVARSYIGPGCMLHQNFIGDSVLESGINPSWGTTLANWRLDQGAINMRLPEKTIDTEKTKLGAVIAREAFLGVNCSVMPGITIGRNAKIYPGTVVKDPVKDDEIIGLTLSPKQGNT